MTLLETVFNIMKDGKERSLEEISKRIGRSNVTASNALTYLAKKGYVERIGRALYQGNKGMTYGEKSKDTFNRMVAPTQAGSTPLCAECAKLSTLRESLISAQKANIKIKLHYKEELRRLRRKYSAMEE